MSNEASQSRSSLKVPTAVAAIVFYILSFGLAQRLLHWGPFEPSPIQMTIVLFYAQLELAMKSSDSVIKTLTRNIRFCDPGYGLEIRY
jgi:hypothetical protein